MRKPALVAMLVAAALVASLVATIPGRSRGPEVRKAKVMTGVVAVTVTRHAPETSVWAPRRSPRP